MNILIKKLITSKKIQDTAGVIRGTYRIFDAYRSNTTSSLVDLEDSQNLKTEDTNRPFKNVNKKEDSSLDEDNKMKMQSINDDNEKNILTKEDVKIHNSSINIKEEKKECFTISNEQKSIIKIN